MESAKTASQDAPQWAGEEHTMPENVATLKAISEALAARQWKEARRLVRLALTAAETQLAEYDAHWCAQEEQLHEDAHYADLPF
jgi:hypothetical protein